MNDAKQKNSDATSTKGIFPCLVCREPIYDSCLIVGGSILHEQCKPEMDARANEPMRSLVAMLADCFGVPKPMLGDPERTTTKVMERIIESQSYLR